MTITNEYYNEKEFDLELDLTKKRFSPSNENGF